MRKTVGLLCAALLAAVMFTGICAQTKAYALDGDVITFADDNFRLALIDAGVDKDSSGTITQGEMADPGLTSLKIDSGAVTNIAGISYASNLTSLEVTGTGITSVPAEIIGMTNLRTLIITNHAQLGTDGLPAELWWMTGLTTLNLYGDGLTYLPGGIGNLINLTELDLQSNSLTALPAQIASLTKLVTLNVWGNNLTSISSSMFSGLTSLTRLDIVGNYLNLLPGSDDTAEINILRVWTQNGVLYSPQNDYTVSLDYNGGTGAALPKSQYYHGELIVLPEATKQGYIFAGWDTDGDGFADKAGGEGVIVYPSPLTRSSVQFEAIYGYTVTFKAQPYGTIDGGTADITEEIPVGGHVSAIPSAAANTGYEFLGWYDGGTAVTNDDMLAAAVNAYKTYTARFQAVGTVAFPDAAFKAALTAAGADANADGFITETEMQARTELTLTGGGFTDLTGIGYAWNLQRLTLGAGDVTALPAEIGNLTSLRFLDLSRNPIASVPPEFGNLMLETLRMNYCGLAILPTQVTAYSTYQNLELSGNRLTQVPGALSGMLGLTSLDLSGNRIMGIGDNFFEPLYTLTQLNLMSNYLNPDAPPAGLPAFTLITPQNTCAVTLNFNGGTGLALPKTGYWWGEAVTLPAAAKDGFAFLGWDPDADDTAEVAAGASVPVIPASLDTPSVTFKAIYGYTVTFRTEANGTIGGGSVDITEDVAIGGKVSAVPAAAAKSGYNFLGWYDGAVKLTQAQILSTAITANKTFLAKYEPAGIIAFPDAAFRSALIAAGADVNSDGYLTQTDMAAVTALSLTGGAFTNLTGIGYATGLTSLTLGAGRVTALPAEIGSLASLRTLNLDGNALTGLPTAITGLTGLTTLSMNNCGLRTLPAQVASLSGLKTLNLSGNLLTAVQASSFASMSLTGLNLTNNYLNPLSPPAGLPSSAALSPQKAYAVSLNYNGGTGSNLPKALYYYNEAIPLPAASKAGYTFTGWDTDADGLAETQGTGTVGVTPNPPNAVTSVTFKALYKSANALLSGIALSAGTYRTPATFDPAVSTYAVTLYDYVGSVTVTPAKASAAASMKINGAAAAALTVQLAPGASATVTVAVTAEDGVTKRSYTLNIRRAAPVSLDLSGITYSPGVRWNPVFSSGITGYVATLPSSVGSATFTAKLKSTAASVAINGVAGVTRTVSVAQGMSATVTIVVRAPAATDKTKTYTISLKRGTSLSKFAAAPKIGAYPTLSPGGTNRMTFSYTMNGPGAVKVEVYKSGRWQKLMTRSEATAGAKKWAWDGRLSGATLPVATYKVRITPSAYGLTGTSSTLTVKIVKYPVVTWRAVATTFRATGAVRTLCQFKASVPTNAVVRVYNSRGRIAAVLNSYTNLYPGVYKTVAWNGRATAGNTAYLKAGTLVPKGYYTIRITVGAKTYTKTIKITR